MAYEIRFVAIARRHLLTFSAHQRAVIVDAVESQLSHEPLVEVRNRKRLRPNPKLGAESIVITSNNKPVAALVSLKGAERESLALSLHPTFRRIIRRARAEAQRGKVFSLEQIKAELVTQEEKPAKRLPSKRVAATRGPSARKSRPPR